jgi:prepilin-type N-terminal cleavage/methylation domain-containing protein
MNTTCVRRQGFTLIELLVVLAVIGLLISILLPAVMGGLDAGKTAHCQNNLAQIGKTIPMYAADNKDSLPYFSSGVNRWDTSLLPYLGSTTNVFWCVADPYGVPTNDRISYGANGYSDADHPFRRSFSGNPPAKLREFDTDNMGDLILIADLYGSDAALKPRIGQGSAQVVRTGRYPNLHKKGTVGNYLMASMAVRKFSNVDPLVTKTSGQGNLWTFVAPPMPLP